MRATTLTLALHGAALAAVAHWLHGPHGALALVSGRHHRRNAAIANVTDAELASFVMTNCSTQVTLAFCTDESTKWRYYCVGSTSTKSCPRSPIVLEITQVADVDYVLDASELGIERIVPSPNISVDRIDVQKNRIKELVMTDLGLAHLQLAWNQFTSFESIQFPRNVRHLNVSHNALQRLELVDADTRLETVDATNTSLVELDTAIATGLIALYAAHNRLASIDDIALGNPLRVLDLSYNTIDDWSQFRPPRSLRKLYASHNNATRFLQGNWSEDAPKLEAVDFSHNAITSIRGIAWPKTFTQLDLRGNPIQVIEIDSSEASVLANLEKFLVPPQAAKATNTTCAELGATALLLPSQVTVCVVPSASSSSFSSADDDADNQNGSSATVSSSGSDDSDSPTPTSTTSPTNAADATNRQSIRSANSSARGWLVGVGVALLLAVIVAVFVIKLRSRRAASRRDSLATSKGPATLSSLHSEEITHRLEATRSNPKLVAFHINATDAKQLRVIHSTSSVRTCLVQVGESVMVRRQLREQAALLNDRAVLQLIQEIECSAPLEHDRLVLFRGFTCTSAMDLAVYQEYMANGSLDAFLKLRGASPTHRQEFAWLPTTRAAPTSMDQVSRLDFAIAVAEAMAYLHSFNPPVVHGNIRAKHVLIDAQWHAKLTRVGVRLERADFDKEKPGAVAWLAPELLREPIDSNEEEEDADATGCFSPASDVYAFGVLLAELDSCGVQPFGHLLNGAIPRSNSQLASEIVKCQLKPLFHAECPTEIRAIALSCLDPDPEARPTALKLSYELAQIRKRVGTN